MLATIIGARPFEPLAEKGFPVVVSGFEARDILLGINLLQTQAEEGISRVDNGYPRAVKPEGNQIALKIMEKVFETSDSEWRGIGKIEDSGLVLRKEFEEKDAAKKHEDLYASALEDIRKKAGEKTRIAASVQLSSQEKQSLPNARISGRTVPRKIPRAPVW